MNQQHQKLYREATKSDWKRTGIYISLTIFVITAGGLFLIPKLWPIGIIIWLLLFVGCSMILLVKWHSKTSAYRCPNCNHEFEISAWKDFISPHLPDKKYLKCPSCGERKWAKALIKKRTSNS